MGASASTRISIVKANARSGGADGVERKPAHAFEPVVNGKGIMNTTMALEMNATPSERMAFLAVPARRAAEQITGTTNDLIANFQNLLDQIMANVCGNRTAEEFLAARQDYFPKYAQVMMVLGSLISVVVPPSVVNRLTWESLSEMEADFREEGRAAFGNDISDQAIFTVWTMRKIHDVVNSLDTSKQPADIQVEQRLAVQCVGSLLYSRFHLDCLKMSLRSERVIYPDVLEAISEGLRSLVNAYAYVRQMSALRAGDTEEKLIQIDFDDEEAELLSESMRDLAAHA